MQLSEEKCACWRKRTVGRSIVAQETGTFDFLFSNKALPRRTRHTRVSTANGGRQCSVVYQLARLNADQQRPHRPNGRT